MLLLGRLPVWLLHHRLLRLLEMRLLREWRLLRRLLLRSRLRLELLRLGIWIVVGHWILFSSLATMPSLHRTPMQCRAIVWVQRISQNLPIIVDHLHGHAQLACDEVRIAVVHAFGARVLVRVHEP